VVEVIDDGEKSRKRHTPDWSTERVEVRRSARASAGRSRWAASSRRPEHRRGQRGPGIDDVVETIAGGAAEYAIDSAAGNPGAAFCASELMCRDFHGFS